MKSTQLFSAGALALVILLGFIISWEWYWRQKGFTPTYNDDKMLWAAKRAEATQPAGEATVFIGSSRIKFDLDLPEWKKLTGENAVQLSLVGTSPLLLLKDLANDTAFKGKLVIDITEPLFFSKNPAFHRSALDATTFYKKQTPSEKLSSRINFALESKFVFLEERKFSLNEFLNDLQLPNRPGVFAFPSFPKAFELNTFDRQTYMPEMFLLDSQQVNRQTDIWKTLIMGSKEPPVSGETLQQIFAEVKNAVDKIRSRGGQVIFTRTPSSGPMGEGEQAAFPRQTYWDALLGHTQTAGLHFKDNPITAKLVCPEWSHLAPKDAVVYTRELVKGLRRKNWFHQDIAKR